MEHLLGKHSARTVLFLLGSLLAGLVWFISSSAPAGLLCQMPLPVAALSAGPSSHADREDTLRGAAPAGTRREAAVPPVAATPDGAGPRAAPAFERVRVHGQVHRYGSVVPEHDLVFHAVGEGLDADGEWEFTDALGRYEAFLRPGDYHVLNDAQGGWAKSVSVPGDSAELLLDIDLPPGAIHGHVLRGEGGGAAASASVSALRCVAGGADAITQAVLARGGRARSRRDGSFQLRDLPPGEYLLTARRGSLCTPQVRVQVRQEPVEDLQLVFLPGETLSGVVRGPEGRPVSVDLWILPGDCVVSLAQLFNRPPHYSGRDGSFALPGLQPGPYLIFAAGESGGEAVAARAAIAFRAGEPPVTLEARACGALAVTVCRSDGTPVPGACLDIRSSEGELVPASRAWLEDGVRSDAEGRIALDDVLPGRYRIAAGGAGGLGTPASVEVRSRACTEVRLVSE